MPGACTAETSALLGGVWTRPDGLQRDPNAEGVDGGSSDATGQADAAGAPLNWTPAQEQGPRSESQTGSPWPPLRPRARARPGQRGCGWDEGEMGPTTVLGAAWEAGALGNGIPRGAGGQAGWHPAHRPGTPPSCAWGPGFCEDDMRPPTVTPSRGGHTAGRPKVPPVVESRFWVVSLTTFQTT